MKPVRPKPKALPKRQAVPETGVDRIVVDSYFRLERNLADGVFPLHAEDGKRREMAERIRCSPSSSLRPMHSTIILYPALRSSLSMMVSMLQK